MNSRGSKLGKCGSCTAINYIQNCMWVSNARWKLSIDDDDCYYWSGPVAVLMFDRAANSDRGQALQGGITGDKFYGSKQSRFQHNHVYRILSSLA
jgi:hypothetical protein